jgi:hypothetical protein
MVEVVHCVYNQQAHSNILLHILAKNDAGSFILPLGGVNIHDDQQAIAETARLTLGIDILDGQETISPHCELTNEQMLLIISRTAPEISQNIIATFPSLLSN